MGILNMISSLDRNLSLLLSENHANDDESATTIENIENTTGDNTISSVKKNVVDVTSKNFISSANNNVIQSPFIARQSELKPLTAMKKGDGSGDSLYERIVDIFKF